MRSASIPCKQQQNSEAFRNEGKHSFLSREQGATGHQLLGNIFNFFRNSTQSLTIRKTERRT